MVAMQKRACCYEHLGYGFGLTVTRLDVPEVPVVADVVECPDRVRSAELCGY